jgi:hypothetical protein
MFARPPVSGTIARNSQLPVNLRSLLLLMITPENEKGPRKQPLCTPD